MCVRIDAGVAFLARVSDVNELVQQKAERSQLFVVGDFLFVHDHRINHVDG